MKILHISNFVQKHNGRLNWNQCFKINNGLIRNGHNVCIFSDRDISRQNPLNKINNNKYLNRLLLATFKNYNPDLVILGHADKVNNETLDKFKFYNKNIKIIEWNVDNYYLDKTEKKLTKRTNFIDAFFITNAHEGLSSCLSSKNSISFFPNIFDQSIENQKIFDNKHYDYDVFYALSYGVGTGKIRSSKSDYDREVFLDYIHNNLKSLKTNFFGYKNIQPVWGSDFDREISKSLISLNLSRKPILKYYSSDRISQYLGNGSCIFVDIHSKLNDLFDNDEVVFYDSENIEEFGKKLLHHASNLDVTRRIAKKGWQKGHNNFNDRVITEYFLDTAFNKRPTKEYSWPIHQFFL